MIKIGTYFQTDTGIWTVVDIHLWKNLLTDEWLPRIRITNVEHGDETITLASVLRLTGEQVSK